MHDLSADRTPWRIALIWFAFAIAIALAWDATAWDLPVSRWFGAGDGFALKEHPIWGKGVYRLQRAMAWLGLLVMIAMCLRPVGPFAGWRRSERITLVLTLLVITFVIQYMKRKSLTSCPWSLQEFGGPAQHISHWLRGVRDGGSGRCFPAGHASGALGFLAVPVFMLWHRKRWAYGLLAAVFLAGACWGGIQLMRGAHFVSHTLWSVVICLAVALCMRCALWVAERTWRQVETSA